MTVTQVKNVAWQFEPCIHLLSKVLLRVREEIWDEKERGASEASQKRKYHIQPEKMCNNMTAEDTKEERVKAAIPATKDARMEELALMEELTGRNWRDFLVVQWLESAFECRGQG